MFQEHGDEFIAAGVDTAVRVGERSCGNEPYGLARIVDEMSHL